MTQQEMMEQITDAAMDLMTVIERQGPLLGTLGCATVLLLYINRAAKGLGYTKDMQDLMNCLCSYIASGGYVWMATEGMTRPDQIDMLKALHKTTTGSVN
jgi:hypothetical protein